MLQIQNRDGNNVNVFHCWLSRRLCRNQKKNGSGGNIRSAWSDEETVTFLKLRHDNVEMLNFHHVFCIVFHCLRFNCHSSNHIIALSSHAIVSWHLKETLAPIAVYLDIMKSSYLYNLSGRKHTLISNF